MTPRMSDGAKKMHAALEEAGIKHVFYESEGTAHEFQTWRRSLASLRRGYLSEEVS
jgi:hypothetical protein